METRQYKPVSAILLALFSVQMLLPLLISLSVAGIRLSQEYLIEQHEHEHDEAFFVKIPISEISGFTQDKNEFLYHGTWYDAERTIKENGKTFVLAIPDKKETDLDKLATSHFSKSDKKTTPSDTAPFFTFLFFEAPSAAWHLTAILPEKNYNVYSPSKTINYVTEVNPPPQA